MIFLKENIQFYLLAILLIFTSCAKKSAESNRTPLLEVNGNFLYKEELSQIIPKNTSVIDSANIADRYIRNWVTETLIYENAQRNISNLDEIDKLVEEYRKSLVIHQYEQALVAERVSPNVSEEEMKSFYEQFKSQLIMEENRVKGILLIVPNKAPQLDQVRMWVMTNNRDSWEKIEKYSIQNAISYDFFMNKWLPLTEILKKAPFHFEDSRTFVENTHFVETSDSTKHYFLNIAQGLAIGDTEPYEIAKDKIKSILLNKKRTEFIQNFEKNIYNEAVDDGTVKYFKN